MDTNVYQRCVKSPETLSNTPFGVGHLEYEYSRNLISMKVVMRETLRSPDESDCLILFREANPSVVP